MHKTLQPQKIIISGQITRVWVGGTGPALLLLHAAWGDAEMSWSSVWNELSRSSTIIAPDLPGFGQSSPLPRQSLSAMAQMQKELLSVLHVHKVTVVGNSFGAAVASQFASAYPKIVSQVVLVNGGYMPAIPGGIKYVISMPLLKQGLGFLMRRHTFSRRTLRKSFVNALRLPPDFFDSILLNSRKYAQIGFDSWLNMTGPMAKPLVPTFLIWGTKDCLGSMKHAHFIQEWISGSRLIPIEEAGHMPQIDQPQDFIAAITSISQVPRSS